MHNFVIIGIMSNTDSNLIELEMCKHVLATKCMLSVCALDDFVELNAIYGQLYITLN